VNPALASITAAKARYCRGVDAKDWELFGSAFALDALFDLRDFPFSRDPVTNARTAAGSIPIEVLAGLTAGVDWPIVGRERIVEFCRVAMAPVVSAHHVFAPEITLDGRSSATVIWPMEDYTWHPPESPVSYMHGFGHYHETYVAIEDDWRIASVHLSRLRVEWR
jgi:hypothetical protein